MAEERKTTPFTWIAAFILILIASGALALYFGAERAVDVQREEGEGVLQERAERQQEVPEEVPAEEAPPPAPGEERQEEGQFGVTEDGRLLVDEWRWATEGNQTFIRGAIENLTAESLGPVVMVFELQDGAARAVGSAEEEIGELQARQSHEYEIPVENPQAVQARLLEVIIRQQEAGGTP